ncbi:ABC transporter ATP-binding protein [Sinomonas sp. ASV322]|uniref:ABC transporter ATP-binding protein n=1 Tax=Sinomonas sp. ASV322 TaxID=3041920 RepID=UPI0027DE7959|nr:ABC transporter ATP-binding protein [Sinomonas sp. ASV322]MDQ4501787.1 ABC transporter ATP-binding protein [Sinomonas sp. ASV322]
MLEKDDFPLNVHDVGFVYPSSNAPALTGVSFCIEAGEIVGLVGPNGSGKSTLIRLIFNLMERQEGAVLVNGVDHRSETARIGAIHLPSDNELPEFLTGVEYIRVLAGLYRQIGPTDERIQEQFSTFGMAGRSSHLIEDYSHGMQKKLLLSSAFLLRRRLTVIDETLNGIDLDAVDVCKAEFRDMRSRGQSVLLCSHDFSLLEDVADRVLVLRAGKLVADLDVGAELAGGSRLSRTIREALDCGELA